MSYYVYILAGRRNGTLYIGVTNDLIRRVWEHKADLVDGFTKRHGVHKLVYFEQTDDPLSAIQREKQMKKWNRKWNWILLRKPILIGGIFMLNLFRVAGFPLSRE